MTRFAIFLTIFLALGTGDSLTLLCQAFCDRRAVADIDACHHSAPTAPLSVREDQSCEQGGAPIIAEIRDQANQKTVEGSRTSSAIIESHELSTVAIERALLGGGPPRLSSEHRLRDIALRI